MLFETKSGSLIVSENNGIYTRSPSRLPVVSNLPNVISMALNIQPIEVLKSRDYVLVYEPRRILKT